MKIQWKVFLTSGWGNNYKEIIYKEKRDYKEKYQQS